MEIPRFHLIFHSSLLLFFFQPLEDPSPQSSPKQDPPSPFPQQQESPLVSPPSIVLDDFSTNIPFDSSSADLSPCQRSGESGPDLFFAGNTSANDYTDFSGSERATLSPSSNAPTEASSAGTSDSELPHLPHSKPSAPTLQSVLLGFFAVVPADEAHTAVWRKRRNGRMKTLKIYVIVIVLLSRNVAKN